MKMKMTKGLMLVMMLVDKDVLLMGEVDAYEACKDAMEQADVMQEVPEVMLVMRDAMGEDNDVEDVEWLDADDDVS